MPLEGTFEEEIQNTVDKIAKTSKNNIPIHICCSLIFLKSY